MQDANGKFDLKVLIIRKGCSSSFISHLSAHFTNIKIVEQLEEPLNEDDITKGIEILSNEISTFQPQLLLAGSRGGKYATALLHKKLFSGPTVLISAVNVCTGVHTICH